MVHWNNGLHDSGCNLRRGPVQFSIGDYLRNLEEIYKQLQATGAKIIWATTTVKFPEMVNNHFESATLINMKEDDWRIGENPKPVAFPAGFVGMDERSQGQRLLQGFIKRLSLLGKFVVEPDDTLTDIARYIQNKTGIKTIPFYSDRNRNDSNRKELK